MLSFHYFIGGTTFGVRRKHLYPIPKNEAARSEGGQSARFF